LHEPQSIHKFYRLRSTSHLRSFKPTGYTDPGVELPPAPRDLNIQACMRHALIRSPSNGPLSHSVPTPQNCYPIKKNFRRQQRRSQNTALALARQHRSSHTRIPKRRAASTQKPGRTPQSTRLFGQPAHIAKPPLSRTLFAPLGGVWLCHVMGARRRARCPRAPLF